jgi:hypothetical protein
MIHASVKYLERYGKIHFTAQILVPKGTLINNDSLVTIHGLHVTHVTVFTRCANGNSPIGFAAWVIRMPSVSAFMPQDSLYRYVETHTFCPLK